MISVTVRMMSPTLQPGPFTWDMAELTVRALLAAANLPAPVVSPVHVQLQLVRPTDDAVLVQQLVLEASRSPIGTTRWIVYCPGCHARRWSRYLVGSSLFCAGCCGLKYTTRTVSAPVGVQNCLVDNAQPWRASLATGPAAVGMVGLAGA